MLAADTLTKTFGARVAVERVSFELGRGEIFALVGPNGAGKTTTLRMLAGLITPSSGTVRFRGEATSARYGGAAGRTGFLTETPGLWERLTVRPEPSRVRRLQVCRSPSAPWTRRWTCSASAIARPSPPRCSRKGCASGSRWRAPSSTTRRSCCSTSRPPASIPESARDVRELVLRLRDERRAVLLSTHNLDEVDRLADRVAVLNTHARRRGQPRGASGPPVRRAASASRWLTPRRSMRTSCAAPA